MSEPTPAPNPAGDPPPTPQAPPATPPASPPPAATRATLDMELGFDNSHGWRTVADMQAAINDANNRLSNPKGPEGGYVLDGVSKYWEGKEINGTKVEIKADDPQLNQLAEVLHAAGISQAAFDRIVPQIQEHGLMSSQESAKAWQEDAIKMLGGAENATKAVQLAEQFGLGEVFAAARGDALVTMLQMMNHAASAQGEGGGTGVGVPQPGQSPHGGQYAPEWSMKMDGKSVGLDPENFDSIMAFAALQNKDGRLLIHTPEGKALHAKALQWRAQNGKQHA